jgi:3-methyladenine DNA glycosylase AlkD
MIGVLSLVFLFEKKESKVTKSQVYRYYIKHAKKINNWDFVDVSAHKIVGRYIDQQPEEKKILQQLAQSNNLWERRISIVSTLYLIKKGDFKETIRIAKILLYDEHDLIHKAVGWMLREVGKQSEEALVSFLDKHAINLSRTSLRYSIERLPKEMKSHYMKIK